MRSLPSSPGTASTPHVWRKLASRRHRELVGLALIVEGRHARNLVKAHCLGASQPSVLHSGDDSVGFYFGLENWKTSSVVTR